MSNFSPYQTTAQNQAEVLDRANEVLPGSKQVVRAYVQSVNANTGHGKHAAVFEYSDGTIERMEGK